MKRSPVKFMCTGMCGADHPVHDHCKDCSHAEFVSTVTMDSGKKIKVMFNMLHGAFFGGEKFPSVRNPIWKEVQKIKETADRMCKKWNKKKESK